MSNIKEGSLQAARLGSEGGEHPELMPTLMSSYQGNPVRLGKVVARSNVPKIFK